LRVFAIAASTPLERTMQINAKPTFAAQTTRAVDLDTQSRASQRLGAGQTLNPTGSAETQQSSRLGLQNDQRIQPGQDTFALGAEFLARPRPISGSAERAEAARGISSAPSQGLSDARSDTAERIREDVGRLREQAQTSGAQMLDAQANLQPERVLALMR
jgi:hypothetical protein